MKKAVFFTIMVLLMPSCSKKETSNYSLDDVPIVIDIDAVKTDTLKINYLHYIPLETTKDCLIGSTGKVVIKNDKIYFADFRKTMSLFVFDMNGKFLFKIDKRGQGPGEYLSFRDFDIQNNGDIYIFDHYKQKFLVYSPEGKYIRDIQSDLVFLSFCLFDNKMYWSHLWNQSGEMYAYLAVYDMIDKKAEFLFKDEKYFNEINLTYYNSYIFYYSPDSIFYFSPKLSEIIYSIDKNGIHPAIGIKNLRKPSDELIDVWVKNKSDLSLIGSEKGFFLQTVNIFETDKYITFAPRNIPYNYTVLYNKQSKSSCFLSDLNIGTYNVNGSIGKYFFSVVEFDLELRPDYKHIIESREELKNWQEDDNPVIVIFEPAN